MPNMKTRSGFAVLGGEHIISQVPIKAHLEKCPDLSMIQFDAHVDLRDTYEGSKFSHACMMARVCEFMDPARVVQVGIRATGDRIPSILPRVTQHVYVTFDADAFDTPIMPSTGTPESNGLFWAETMKLLRMIGEQKSIVGCDVVELAPIKALPHPDYTTAKLTYRLMNYAFQKPHIT